MTRAKRFLDEALQLLGEAEKDDTVDFPVDDTMDDTTPDLGDTTGDDLDLGAETEEPPVDDFGLGGSSTAPTVRIEKDGPITVNKGDVQLSIGDDGAIDITLDNLENDLEPSMDDAGLGDMTDKTEPAVKPEGEEDDYNIDWEKEKENKPEESFKEDFKSQVMTSLDKDQNPAIKGNISKAKQILNMEDDSVDVVRECLDKKYECASCECNNECQDKNKKMKEEEDDSDFLSQGYL